MRLYEFTNAEEQLGLLRIIIDNTWTAIAQQAKQKKDAEAQRKAQAKSVPRKTKGAKHIATRMPPPNQPPHKKAPPPQAKQAKPLPTPISNTKQPTAMQNRPIAPKDGYLGQKVSAREKGEYGDDGHSENGFRNDKKLPRNF